MDNNRLLLINAASVADIRIPDRIIAYSCGGQHSRDGSLLEKKWFNLSVEIPNEYINNRFFNNQIINQSLTNEISVAYVFTR